MKTRKQKVSEQTEQQSPTKKAKQENKNENENVKTTNGKPTSKEYEEFCKAITDTLSIDQIKEILQVNGQDPSSIPDETLISQWYVIS